MLTAFNLTNNPALSALLTGGVVFDNDLYKILCTGDPKDRDKDFKFACIDAVTQGIVALVGSGVQPGLDGTSLGKKEVIDFIVNKVKASELVDIITAGVAGGVVGAVKDFSRIKRTDPKEPRHLKEHHSHEKESNSSAVGGRIYGPVDIRSVWYSLIAGEKRRSSVY